MLCDEDLTIDKEKFAKLMRTNQDETNRVCWYYWFCLYLYFLMFHLVLFFIVDVRCFYYFNVMMLSPSSSWWCFFFFKCPLFCVSFLVWIGWCLFSFVKLSCLFCYLSFLFELDDDSFLLSSYLDFCVFYFVLSFFIL